MGVLVRLEQTGLLPLRLRANACFLGGFVEVSAVCGPQRMGRLRRGRRSGRGPARTGGMECADPGKGTRGATLQGRSGKISVPDKEK